MRTCTNKEQETCGVEKRGCIGCAYAKSKRMFSELGYEEILDDDPRIITYRSKEKNKYRNGYGMIIFDIEYERFDIVNVSIDMNLLLAINKKCEELGWL